MIIASKNLQRYLHTLQFPVKILTENKAHVAMTASYADFMVLVETESVIGIGTFKRIKHFCLNRPIEKVQMLRVKLLNSVPMATPLHYRDQLGDTHSVIVIKRLVNGEFHRWDNSFSVKEMRENPNAVKSAASRLADAVRRADRAFQKTA